MSDSPVPETAITAREAIAPPRETHQQAARGVAGSRMNAKWHDRNKDPSGLWLRRTAQRALRRLAAERPARYAQILAEERTDEPDPRLRRASTARAVGAVGVGGASSSPSGSDGQAPYGECCASCDGSRCSEHCCDGFNDPKPASRYQVQP